MVACDDRAIDVLSLLADVSVGLPARAAMRPSPSFEAGHTTEAEFVAYAQVRLRALADSRRGDARLRCAYSGSAQCPASDGDPRHWAHHVFSCKHLSKDQTLLHEALKNAFVRLISPSGIPFRKEPTYVVAGGNGNLRADVEITTDRTIAIDFTFVLPPRGEPLTTAMRRRTDQKNKKYEKIQQQHGVEFEPFPASARFGAADDGLDTGHGVAFLNKVAAYAAVSNPDATFDAPRMWRAVANATIRNTARRTRAFLHGPYVAGRDAAPRHR